MKRLTLYMILLLAFVSCDKYLEVQPSNILALKNYDDIKSLMGSHLKMYTVSKVSAHKLSGTNVPWRYTDLYLFWGFYSDELDTDKWFNGNWMASNYRELYSNSLNWKHSKMPGEIWKLYYGNIGFYNTIIDELANVSASREEKDIVEQEARFLRSWNLFKVLQYFSPYHENKLGIPFNTDSQAVGHYDKKRKTQEQVYEFLIKELNTILDCNTEPRSSYNIFYDKKIVHALLAEVYHFKGGSGAGVKEDYDHAIEHAKAAMEGRSLQGVDEFKPFPVMTSKSAGIYKDKPGALLVDAAYSSDEGMYATYEKYRLLEYGKEKLFNLYDDKDVRKSLYFNETNKAIRKFRDLPAYLSVFNFFQIAEMHLIVAESYAHKGANNEAKQWLEEFQRHRIRDYRGFSGTDVLQEIMDERQREFCLENDMRWCDLIRTQKGWTRNSYQNPKEPTYTLEDKDFRFCLPIPLTEELQENNQIEQNPGWSML